MKPIRCFSRLISPQRSGAILKGLGLPVIKGSQHNRIMFSAMKIHWTCLLFGSAATALGAGPDWPQFMGPHRNGSTQAQAIQDDWRNHPPKKLWSLEMGSGFSGPSSKTTMSSSIIAWEGTCTWIASHWIPENRFGNPLMRRNIGIDLVSMMVQALRHRWRSHLPHGC